MPQGFQLIARKPRQATYDLRTYPMREQSAAEGHASVLPLQGRIVYGVRIHQFTLSPPPSILAFSVSQEIPRNSTTQARRQDGKFAPVLQGDESTMRKKKKILRPTIESQRWPGASTLTAVRRLNARCLAHLAGQLHEDATLSALWTQMDTRACERAGRCPVLLIDLNFQRPEWWQRASQRIRIAQPSEGASRLENDGNVSLVREILMDAWTIGRTMPRALNLIFGMASPVTATIIQMGVPEIDSIAAEEGRKLKARWPESRSFWRNLLSTAIGTDDQALAKVHLHCLQLLGSELMLP
jgi:hypothetical protein